MRIDAKRRTALIGKLLLLAAGTLLTVTAVAGGLNRGAPQMTLYGGSIGKVPFPHQRHQTTPDACQTCHALFPQTAESIERLKEQGQLQKKQVMKHCQQCHRDKAKAGEKTGPTSCRDCHLKSG